MSKRIITLTMVVLVLGFAWSAMADIDTENMNVSADVAASCTINSVGDVIFGTSAWAPLTTATSDESAIRVTCVANTGNVQVSFGDGLHLLAGTAPTTRQMANGSHMLAYSLTTETAGAGTCLGSEDVCSAVGTIAYAQTGAYVDHSAFGFVASGQTPWVGSYADTVVVTVTF